MYEQNCVMIYNMYRFLECVVGNNFPHITGLTSSCSTRPSMVIIRFGGLHEQFVSMLIFKILRKSEWDALRSSGESKGSSLDLEDGYIHLSTAAQVRCTVSKYFATMSDLILVAIGDDDLGEDLKWEASRGGALFPHLYRVLRISDVVWEKPLPLGPSGHAFPDNII